MSQGKMKKNPKLKKRTTSSMMNAKLPLTRLYLNHFENFYSKMGKPLLTGKSMMTD
jgi:hypothetical protein